MLAKAADGVYLGGVPCLLQECVALLAMDVKGML